MLRTRNGLTLLEIFVLILILLFLVAMMLPAIERAGPAARRSACANNLKQIALAVHSYHDAHNKIVPLAAHDDFAPSWVVLLFPYMEQRSLYNQLTDQADQLGRFDLQAARGQQHPLDGFVSSSFYCPERRGPTLCSDTGLGYRTTPTDYAACNSTSDCWAVAGDTYAGQRANGAIVFASQPGWPYEAALSFADISDGLSFTAMFGEKHLPRRAKLGTMTSLDGPCVVLGNNPMRFNNVTRRLGSQRDEARDCDPVRLSILGPFEAGDKVRAGFGSWHNDICQFAMGDGSVQQILNYTEPAICTRMIQRDDGQAWSVEQ